MAYQTRPDSACRSPTEKTSRRPLKRPRVLVACLRCKARRQKCDNKSPACSNCARANLSCNFAENEYPSSYVKTLEDRVALLETQLHSVNNFPSVDHIASHNTTVDVFSDSGGRKESGNSESPSNLVDGVGFLSSCATAEPHYFGVSSGTSLAQLIEVAVYENGLPSTDLRLPSSEDRPFSCHIPKQGTKLVALPSPEIGQCLIEAYLSRIHPLFPFLSRNRLWEIHKNNSMLENVTTIEAEVELIMLHFVYAIGARCLQLIGSKSVSDVSPEGHYVSAMAKIHDNLKIPSVGNIQIMLLVAIYAMRSPSGSSVWHLCGLMMRHCLELGLHRQVKIGEGRQFSDQMRKRLFWSIYLLERKVALVLGRPFAISDTEIDANLPLDINDMIEDRAQLAEAEEQRQGNVATGTGQRLVSQSNMSFHIQHILLDQINTKIRLTLCRLNKGEPQAKIQRKISKRMQELEDWKNSLPGSTNSSSASDSRVILSTTGGQGSQPQNFAEHERLELLLSYYKSRRMFLQTLITESWTIYNGSSDFEACAKAAGQICQLYRHLHRLVPVPFSLLDLHSVFVAGFTMVYCVWTNPSSYDAELAADLGACSTVLYVIAEQWTSAKKYRDAFEVVAEKTVKYVLSTSAQRQRERDVGGETAGMNAKRQNTNLQDYTPQTSQLQASAQPLDGSANGSGQWAESDFNTGFDVWQMMNQFVETQDNTVLCNDMSFNGIEELLSEEGLGWFSGGSYEIGKQW